MVGFADVVGKCDNDGEVVGLNDADGKSEDDGLVLGY